MSNLIDQSLGKPIQGVSQQAEALRGKGQCTEQINFIADPAFGLRRRPPTQNKLTVTANDIYKDYTDVDGDKVLCVGNGELNIYDVRTNTLTAVTVDSDAFDYINANTAQGNLSTAYVEDKLYISNKSVTVLEDETYVPPTRDDNIAVIYCLGGQYAKEYKIEVTYDDDTTASLSFTTADGTTSGDEEQVASTYIIDQLGTQANTAISNQLDRTIHADHLMLSKKSGATKTVVSVTCSDDEGNIALRCAYGSVTAIEDLPEFAPSGMLLTITGIAGTDDDAYYEFALTNSDETGLASFGQSGVWVESVKSGDEFQFDTTTLPVLLTKNDSSYDLSLAEWKGREIGDADSNETPSILNKQIKDITSMQGRLGILSPDTVLFSRTKRPTELWRQSITGGLVDGDAIDGSGDANTGSHLSFVKNAQDIGVFATQGQYVILGNVALTYNTMNLTVATYNTSVEGARPVGVANNIYYAVDNGDFTGMAEYFKEDNTYFSLPVSDHVPRYVLGNATNMVGSDTQRMLAIQTDDDAKTIYCYKFLLDKSKRLQSAWFKFQFEQDVKHTFFTQNSMIIITTDGVNDTFERIDFDSIIRNGLDFVVHLDRQKDYVIDADGKITVDAIHDDDSLIVVSVTSSSAGTIAPSVRNGDGTFSILTGTEGDTVTVGYRYQSLYIPSAPRIFDKAGEVVKTGVLFVRDLFVNAFLSGTFDWKVKADYGAEYEGSFSNRVWGATNNKIGGEPLTTQQWRIPFRGKASERQSIITCDKHTPLNISYIEFVGDLRKNRRRM